MSDEPHDPLIGQTISGRFDVERLLGEGGMGRVYLGTQTRLGRKVAIKVLHPHLSNRKDMALRFQREAKTASMLNHPSSVTVYDFGAWQGMLYIVMELLDGRGLDKVLQREFPMPPERVVYFMAQLCDVLAVAHRADLLHRDLKPENLVIVQDAEGRDLLKVVDFGLAFLMEGDKDQRLTQDGSVSGTPAYMSPEQALDRQLDARSDIYAVGCILYELLCGSPPFEGSSPVECLAMHLYDEPVAPSKRARHEVHRGLEAAALWCLEKAPDHRPQRIEDVKAALLEALDQSSGGALLARAAAQTQLSRDARAQKAGLGATTRSDRPSDGAGLTVRVFQASGTEFSASAASALRSQGATCAVDEGLEPAPALGAEPPDAVVVDIRGREAEGLARVAQWLAAKAFGVAPVVIVGPETDFAVIARAQALGVEDYLGESQLSKLPKRLAKAVKRTKRA